MNHKDQIRSALLRGEELTFLSALNRFGCARLPARIYDLKAEGMDIISERVKGDTYHKYYLSREDAA